MAEPACAVFEMIANRTRTRRIRAATDAFIIIIVRIYNVVITGTRRADFPTIGHTCINLFLLSDNNLRGMTFPISMQNTQKVLPACYACIEKPPKNASPAKRP